MVRGIRIWLFAMALFGVTVALPEVAHAKSELVITEVIAPEKDAPVGLTKRLRASLTRAAKPLDFGVERRVGMTVRVSEFVVSETDGLLRITCTLVGKLEKGGTAKSHITFGGAPGKRKHLEKQVLSAVSEGLMVRLAEIARTRAKARASKDDAPKKP